MGQKHHYVECVVGMEEGFRDPGTRDRHGTSMTEDRTLVTATMTTAF